MTQLLPSDNRMLRIDSDAIDHQLTATKVSTGAEDSARFSSEAHAKVLRKLDWHLLPLVTLLFLLSFLDRANIGNARIAGMGTDLHLVGLRYNIAAAIFSVTYCLGQPPSNIILKLTRPSRWIPSIMVVWGLITTLMCLLKTYQQLLIARAFLGIAEAGLVPGVTYYISVWYPRAVRAKRMAIFTSAATLAGAFGGILAYAIEKMEGIGGLHGWQWIFCLEGLVTMLVALIAALTMCDYPETASFLTDIERRYVVGLMRADSEGLATHYHSRFVLQAFVDYKTYLQFGALVGGFAYCSFIIPGYAIILFTPTIIHELGFSAANAQLLSVPPFAAGCIISILVGICSDKHQLRGPYVIGSAIVSITGCLIVYTQVKPVAALSGVIVAAIGIYPAPPLILTWASANAGGDVKRAVAIAIITGLANTGGICASFIFFDPPRFHVGLGVSMGSLGYSLLACLYMMWDYNRINKEKERRCREQGVTDEHRDEFKEKGDDSPLFRYSL